MAARTTVVAAVDDRVPALEHGQRAQRAEPRVHGVEPRPAALEREERRTLQTVAVRRQPLRGPVGGAARARVQRAPGALELVAQLGEVRDDEPCGGRRRRRADVGGEVAQRRVLLVPDGGDERHGAVGDRPHDALVGEREQILEAAAAAREHDHVGAARAEVADRGRDRRGRARALHVRLRDEHVRGRETLHDVGEHVPLGRRVVAGDEPDQPREAGERPLVGVVEQPLRGELRLQPLERGEVSAEAEALDRQRLEPQLAALLVELGPAEDVHALALGEPELERVELAAWHLDRQRRSVLRVLEREEHRRPPLLAAQLGHLAFDPERRQLVQVARDAAVERADGVDLPPVDLHRLDLHALDASSRRCSGRRRTQSSVVDGRRLRRLGRRPAAAELVHHGRGILQTSERARHRHAAAPAPTGATPRTSEATVTSSQPSRPYSFSVSV